MPYLITCGAEVVKEIVPNESDLRTIIARIESVDKDAHILVWKLDLDWKKRPVSENVRKERSCQGTDQFEPIPANTIQAVSLNGERLDLFHDVAKAALWANVSQSAIRKALAGTQKTAGGYRWVRNV